MGTDQTPHEYVVATYDEIRLRFGLGSTDAARMKAKRRRWSPEPPNHPGAVARIRVPKDAWENAEQGERSPRNDSDHPRSNRHLEAVVTIFREERDRLQGERDRLLTERDATQAERDAAQAEVAKLREEREEARIRAAQAESEAKGLREALTEARRPFWRRWIG